MDKCESGFRASHPTLDTNVLSLFQVMAFCSFYLKRKFSGSILSNFCSTKIKELTCDSSKVYPFPFLVCYLTQVLSAQKYHRSHVISSDWCHKPIIRISLIFCCLCEFFSVTCLRLMSYIRHLLTVRGWDLSHITSRQWVTSKWATFSFGLYLCVLSLLLQLVWLTSLSV